MKLEEKIKKLQSTIKILHTWARFDELDPLIVIELCEKILNETDCPGFEIEENK